MRRIAALCAVGLFVPSLCAADPFNEFRIPAHSWQSGTALFSAFGSRYDASTASSTDERSKSQGARVSGDFRFDQGFDSERLAHGWGIGLAQDLNVTRSESAASNDFSAVRDRDKAWSRGPAEAVVLSGYVRSYREDSQIGLDVSANASAQWFDEIRVVDRMSINDQSISRYERRETNQQIRYLYDASLSSTLGFGVVRDATVVQDVFVLERRLEEAGALSRPLSAAGRARLAEVLVAIFPMVRAHERPTRFAWREIERVLREDGALKDGNLDAYSQAYAMESYRVGPDLRRTTGHFVGLRLQARHDHEISRYDQRTQYRTYDADTLYYSSDDSFADHQQLETNRFDLGPSIEWHRPMGWRCQWDASTRVLVGTRSREKGLLMESGLTVAWLVADRWQARGAFQHSREYRVPETGQEDHLIDHWMARTTLSLDYFLEDHLRLSARLSERQQRSTTLSPYDLSPRRQFVRLDDFSLALTYRFLGRVSAPGLMETMRPL